MLWAAQAWPGAVHYGPLDAVGRNDSTWGPWTRGLIQYYSLYVSVYFYFTHARTHARTHAPPYETVSQSVKECSTVHTHAHTHTYTHTHTRIRTYETASQSAAVKLFTKSRIQYTRFHTKYSSTLPLKEGLTDNQIVIFRKKFNLEKDWKIGKLRNKYKSK